LESFHTAAEAASRSDLRRRHADVFESTEKQFSTKRHPTKQALNAQTRRNAKNAEQESDGPSNRGGNAKSFPPVLFGSFFQSCIFTEFTEATSLYRQWWYEHRQPWHIYNLLTPSFVRVCPVNLIFGYELSNFTVNLVIHDF